MSPTSSAVTLYSAKSLIDKFVNTNLSSKLAELLNRKLPDFDVRNFRFKKFTRFVESLQVFESRRQASEGQQVHTIFMPCCFLISPRVYNTDLNFVFLQSVNNIDNAGIARIRTILLEGHAEP